MAFPYSGGVIFDCATPAGSDDPKAGDDKIREVKSASQQLLDVDHQFGLTGTQVSATDSGKHKKVTLIEVSAPTPVTDYGHLYAMDVSGVTELFWVGGSGTPKQLTSGGKINNAATDLALAVLLAGDQTVAGIKTFSSFLITPSSAPTADYQIANKKYVDDFIQSIAINSVVGTDDISVNSGSYADMLTMTYTDTFISGNVLVMSKFTVTPSVGSSITATLLVDGVVVDVSAFYANSAPASVGNLTLIYSGAVTAASHTIKVQWKGVGSQSGAAYPRTLIIQRGFA